jgi:hypothetical protein
MASLDVQTEYACARPVLSEVEGPILARLAAEAFFAAPPNLER